MVVQWLAGVLKLVREHTPVVGFAAAAVIRGAGRAAPFRLQRAAATPRQGVGWLLGGRGAAVLVAVSVLLPGVVAVLLSVGVAAVVVGGVVAGVVVIDVCGVLWLWQCCSGSR